MNRLRAYWHSLSLARQLGLAFLAGFLAATASGSFVVGYVVALVRGVL